MLKLHDYGVHRAHNNSQAITIMEDQRPDIIICNLDNVSHAEDNHALLQTINSPVKIPIIVVAPEVGAIRNMPPLYASFIVKPFTAFEIQDLILSILH